MRSRWKGEASAALACGCNEISGLQFLHTDHMLRSQIWGRLLSVLCKEDSATLPLDAIKLRYKNPRLVDTNANQVSMILITASCKRSMRTQRAVTASTM